MTDIQTWLRILDCRAGNGSLPEVTGGFFSITRQAVQSYQNRVGASPNGEVDLGLYYSMRYNATQNPPTNTC